MSSNSNRIPFHFHAEGHAFSGEFFRPARHQIEVQAATSLPTIGGHGHVRVEKFDVPRLVSFTNAHTHVSGTWQDEETATTNATTQVEKLKILEVLTADRIVARLTSEHKHNEKEGHIIALGSTFDNLRIAGHEVKISLRHDLFLNNKTFDHLSKQVAKDRKSGRMCITENGVALCSLVEKIETDLPGAEIKGHTLRVPQFGTIAFAEIFAEEGARTLTMMRLELGSPDGALLTVSEARTNGKPMPPTK